MSDPSPESAVGRVTVALVGRQNSGKTSLLMHLTGSQQRPVNFPGSSVERAESSVRVRDQELRVVDLPGIASLSAASPDEELALGYLRGDSSGDVPDVLCAVLDATKLSVELRLVLRLLALGRPVVIALTKTDVESATHAVDAERLGQELGVQVVVTDGRRGGVSVERLRDVLLEQAGRPAPAVLPVDAEHTPDAIQARVARVDATPRRTTTDRLDGLLLHRLLGLPLLALVVFAMFQFVFVISEPFMGYVEAGQEWIGSRIESITSPGALRSFLIDGLINGVGSVIIFLPQIVLLIAFVAVLEGTGYMARAAFLLDRVLCRFGLSGRSFVPLTTSFGCAIPGILASRIIDDERSRIATIVVSPLMSCSARLPVYVLLIGAFFSGSYAGLVLFGLYLSGIVAAVVVALILRRTVLRGGQSVLMMELPAYQWPSLRLVRQQVASAVREFVVLAGTIIFATAIVIWGLSYYPRPLEIHAAFDRDRARLETTIDDPEVRSARLARLEDAEAAAYMEQSFLARAGKAIQPVFAPAGFDWRTTVGVLAAFPARELIVPTLGVLHSVGDADPGNYELDTLNQPPVPDGLRQRMRATLSPAVALALMIFFALCSQCAATLGAIRRETHSWRWPVFTFCYMTGLAWVAAVVVYQIASRVIAS